MRERVFSFLTLFTSMGTLICCALPVLLVSLGMGMAVASLVSSAPWLVSLSHHKDWVFAGSGSLLSFTFFLVYGLPRLRQGSDACEVDADSACRVAGKFTRSTLWISLVIYLAGFFMAYLFLPLKLFFESS